MDFDPTRQIIIVRHGVALHNVAAQTGGELEYFSDKWKHSTLVQPQQDGDIIHQSIKKLGVDIRRDKVICFTSPLIRTIQTMYAAVSDNASMFSHDALIERQGQGHPCNIRESLQQLLAEHQLITFLDQVENMKHHDRPETYSEIRDNISQFIKKHVAKHLSKDKPIILFSHHDAIEAFTGISLRNAECLVYNIITGVAVRLH